MRRTPRPGRGLSRGTSHARPVRCDTVTIMARVDSPRDSLRLRQRRIVVVVVVAFHAALILIVALSRPASEGPHPRSRLAVVNIRLTPLRHPKPVRNEADVVANSRREGRDSSLERAPPTLLGPPSESVDTLPPTPADAPAIVVDPRGLQSVCVAMVRAEGIAIEELRPADLRLFVSDEGRVVQTRVTASSGSPDADLTLRRCLEINANIEPRLVEDQPSASWRSLTWVWRNP